MSTPVCGAGSVGTASRRQVEHLRRLSERNRLRRLAERRKLSGADLALRAREQGFVTYLRGANRRKDEEEEKDGRGLHTHYTHCNKPVSSLPSSAASSSAGRRRGWNKNRGETPNFYSQPPRKPKAATAEEAEGEEEEEEEEEEEAAVPALLSSPSPSRRRGARHHHHRRAARGAPKSAAPTPSSVAEDYGYTITATTQRETLDSDASAYSDDEFDDDDDEEEPDASPESAIDLLTGARSSAEFTASSPSIPSLGSPSSVSTPVAYGEDNNDAQQQQQQRDMASLIRAVRCSQEGMDVIRRSLLDPFSKTVSPQQAQIFDNAHDEDAVYPTNAVASTRYLESLDGPPAAPLTRHRSHRTSRGVLRTVSSNGSLRVSKHGEEEEEEEQENDEERNERKSAREIARAVRKENLKMKQSKSKHNHKHTRAGRHQAIEKMTLLVPHNERTALSADDEESDADNCEDLLRLKNTGGVRQSAEFVTQLLSRVHALSKDQRMQLLQVLDDMSPSSKKNKRVPARDDEKRRRRRAMREQQLMSKVTGGARERKARESKSRHGSSSSGSRGSSSSNPDICMINVVLFTLVIT